MRLVPLAAAAAMLSATVAAAPAALAAGPTKVVISIKVHAARVAVGKPALIAGGLTPKLAGATVTLRHAASGAAIKTGKTNSGGAYTFSHAFPAGVWDVVVTTGGSGTNGPYGAGRSAAVTITVGAPAKITLGADQAVPGTELAVHGTGFAPSATLTLRLLDNVNDSSSSEGNCDDPEHQGCPFPVTTDAQGAFSTSVLIPEGMSGAIDVFTRDNGSTTSYGGARFYAVRAILRLHLSDTTPAAGSTMVITGGGAHAGDPLTVCVNTRPLASITASTTGRFTYDYRLSTGTRGTNSIRVIDTALAVQLKTTFTAHA